MRLAVLVSVLALAACATTSSATRTLTPADSATRLIAGESVTLTRTARSNGGDGQDAATALTMRLADGRTLAFMEANHTPNDVRAQAAGGPLAQVMGLFDETARPTLYAAENAAAAPFCAPGGPAYLGIYDSAEGTLIVGLKEGFQFEERADGTAEALPVSPDLVCSRMRFTRAG